MADDQVQQVKQAVDIVQLVGERVQLKKSGRNMKGLCPFHGEKSPSFFVSPEMQIYKCFGCGESGDVISFVEAYEGMTFPEALELLAERAGITLERRGYSKKDNQREEILEALHLAQEYYHYLLVEHTVGEQARKYLKDRGIPKQLWNDFHLGYAAESWEALQKFLVGKKQLKSEILEQAGLVIRRSNGRGYYDRFRGRVMYPQFDFAGHVVGFAGRVLDPAAKEAKYINTPETSVYDKSKILFGMHLAKKHIRQDDRVVVVEGEMDVISSFKANVKSVVAVKGSALTEGQALLIRRLTKTIVLALDADAAGQEAMMRAIEIGEKQGMHVRVLRLSGGKDPDAIVQVSAKRWREMVKETISVYQFYIDWAFEQFDANSGQGQKQISAFLAPIFKRIENAVERTFYVKKLAERLGVSERVIEEELAKVSRPQEAKEQTEKVTNPRSRRERLERYVLSALLQFGAQVGTRWRELEAEWFGETYLQRLVEAGNQVVGEERMSLEKLRKQLPKELEQMLQELYGADVSLMSLEPSELEEVFVRAKRDLKQMWLREELTRLTKQMGEAENEAELEKWRAEYRRLKQQL